MKKIVAIAFIALLAVSPCFADEGETDTAAAGPAAIQTYTPQPARSPAVAPQAAAKGRTVREAELVSADADYVTGKVVCVAPSDLTRPRGVLTIADSNGTEISFEVKALAVIYDRSGTLLGLCELQSGQDVQVNYRLLRCGPREATSVKVLN